MRRFLLFCVHHNWLGVNIVNLTVTVVASCRYRRSPQTGEQWQPDADSGLHADAHSGVQGDQHGRLQYVSPVGGLGSDNGHKWLTWEAKAKPNKSFYPFLADEPLKWSTLDSMLLYYLICVTGFLSHVGQGSENFVIVLKICSNLNEL